MQDVRVVPEPPSDSSGISRLRIRLVCQGRLFGQAQFEPHTCWAMGLAMSRCMKPVSSCRSSPRTEAAIARLVPGKAALLDLLFPWRSPPAGSLLFMMSLSCSLPENNHRSQEMVGSFPGPVFLDKGLSDCVWALRLLTVMGFGEPELQRVKFRLEASVPQSTHSLCIASWQARQAR